MYFKINVESELNNNKLKSNNNKLKNNSRINDGVNSRINANMDILSKKKLPVVIIVLLLIFLFIFVLQNKRNNDLIKEYSKGMYMEEKARSLSNTDLFQKYIANYNYGNILYQKEKYDDAIKMYEKALNEYVPKHKECKIRINLALSICNTVSVNEKDIYSINNAINIYESAIDVLVEDGCASEDSTKSSRSFIRCRNIKTRY